MAGSARPAPLFQAIGRGASSLATHTIKGRTLALLDLAYRRAANPAGFTAPVINEIALLKIAGLAVDGNKIAQTATALLDRSGQRFANRQHQFLIARQTDSMRRRFGIDTGFEQT